MGLIFKGFKGKGTFPRGIHPQEQKHFSADSAIEVLPAPENVLLPLLQNIGAPCESIVKPKQNVCYGEVVAESKALISASIHAPISGRVMKESVTTLPNARHVPAIPIKAEGKQLEGTDLWDDIFGGEWPKKFNGEFTPKDINKMIDDAGIVGLGGAAFPTYVKITFNRKKPVDTLLINGCECEPYLTPDYRVMLEAPEPVITGAVLAGIATGAKDIIICIEKNKPAAIDLIRKKAEGTNIKVAVLKTKYPQGSERHLIMAVLKKIVPLGSLPADVGTVVSNVGTIAAVARAVLKKKPLTHRVVTVTGGGIKNPKNLLIPIGVSYGELIEYCGGLTSNAARVLSGGPMMGFAFTDFNMPITKGTGGITLLTHEDMEKAKETNCIRCGKCVDVCPMHLIPAKLAQAAKYKNVELAEKYDILACMDSGCCGYICPAKIPLVQLIRMGKAMVQAKRKNRME